MTDETEINLPLYPQQGEIHGAAANVFVYSAIREQLLLVMRKVNLGNANELIKVAESFENNDQIRSFLMAMLSAAADWHIRDNEAAAEYKLTHV